MGWVGLSSLVARGGPVDRVTLLAPGEATRVDADKPTGALGALRGVFSHAGLRSVRWLAPAVLQAGSHMEDTCAHRRPEWLLDAAAKAVRVRRAVGRCVGAGARRGRRCALPTWTEAFAASAAVLTGLVERPGVSAHEWSVRRAVLEALPAWARERAAVDDIGNIMVTPGRTAQRQSSWRTSTRWAMSIESIAEDGTVTLAAQGGVTASAWEGQTALVHFDPPGAPSTVDRRRQRRRPSLDGWRAAGDGAAAGAWCLPHPFHGRPEGPGRRAGVVRTRRRRTGRRVASRSALRSRVTRKGCGSVAPATPPARLTTAPAPRRCCRPSTGSIPHDCQARSIFAFSVHEEGGLFGAAAMARRFGRTTARIYSIDTFVSSDTPLETPHFAHAPLGKGPVLRADRELERVARSRA